MTDNKNNEAGTVAWWWLKRVDQHEPLMQEALEKEIFSSEKKLSLYGTPIPAYAPDEFYPKVKRPASSLMLYLPKSFAGNRMRVTVEVVE